MRHAIGDAEYVRMKSSLKSSLAVAAAGAAGIAGGVVSDWRPFMGDAQKQALERRVNDLQHQLDKTPKVFQIGSNG
jgi:hypothetical protein